MLKIQCQCGHRMAVPDDFAGKRVKCAKCKGAVVVSLVRGAGGAGGGGGGEQARHAPAIAVAPAAASAATGSPSRVHRSRRHALERKQKSHNVTVAIIAGAMLLLGMGLLLFIGSMNRPADVPAPATNLAATEPGSERKAPASPSTLEPIGKTRQTSTTGEMADASRNNAGGDVADDDGVTIAGQRFTAGSSAPIIAGTTSTYEADADVTTIVAQTSPLKVADKTFQMAMTVIHDGRDVRSALQLGALIRISGDFTGLISGANTDDPRLTIEADGRDEFFLPPAQRGESDDRKGQNGVEILPKWVEFSLSKSELKAIAHAKTLRTTLGGTIFDFSDDQRKLFLALIPDAAASGDQPPAPAAEIPGSTEPGAAPGDDGDSPVEKEIMEEKEMMKRR